MNAFDFQSLFGIAASNEVSWADWETESKTEELAKRFQGCQDTQSWQEKLGNLGLPRDSKQPLQGQPAASVPDSSKGTNVSLQGSKQGPCREPPPIESTL